MGFQSLRLLAPAGTERPVWLWYVRRSLALGMPEEIHSCESLHNPSPLTGVVCLIAYV